MESLLKYSEKNLKDILLKKISYRDRKTELSEYRITQILNWIYKKFVFSFENMSNLPQTLRNELKNNFIINNLKVQSILTSSNFEAKKYLLKTEQNEFFEAVRIEHLNRSSVCISSMIGCPLGCKFCATATLKNYRNLNVEEIISQIILLYKEKPFQNIVFMGMGEPLLNFENVFNAISIISNKNLMNFSIRRITISTAGIIDGISKLISLNKKINLAVSLNSPFQEQREILMPIAKSNPLNLLYEELKNFNKKIGRFTFEYVVIPKINDSKKHAEAIISLKKILDFNINLIRFNDFKNCEYNKCSKEDLNKFLSYFKSSNIEVVERISKGSDISAGCGQLALTNY